MVRFEQELGIDMSKNEMNRFMGQMNCDKFRDFENPECVFPGQSLPVMGNAIGIVKSVENKTCLTLN